MTWCISAGMLVASAVVYSLLLRGEDVGSAPAARGDKCDVISACRVAIGNLRPESRRGRALVSVQILVATAVALLHLWRVA